MQEKYMKSKISEIDQKHCDKDKVYISEEYLFNSEERPLRVIYCSLAGDCNEWSRPCVGGNRCPYESIERVKENTLEYSIQFGIEGLKRDLYEHEELKMFLNGDYDLNDKIFKKKLIDKLSDKCSSKALEKMKLLNSSIIQEAINMLKSKSEKFTKKMEAKTRRFKVIGEFLMIEIDWLPDVKISGTNVSYFYSKSYKTNWIKTKDIDSYFLNELKRLGPNTCYQKKEEVEKYNREISAFIKQLEDELGLMTMLKLANN